MESAGAIIVEVQRSAIAYDDATKDSASFQDLAGTTDASGDTSLVWTGNAASPFTTERWVYFQRTATANTLVWNDDLAGANITQARFSDKVPSLLDPVWATVILTWSGTEEWLIVDGVPVGKRTSTPSTRTQRICIAGRGNGATPTPYFRGGNIRRVQFVKRSLAPTQSAAKIAFMGDSFVQRAMDRASGWAEPGTAGNVAVIDAVQNGLAIDGNGTPWSTRLNQVWGNGNWGWWLQALLYLSKGKWFRVYNAADPGNGYRTDLSPFGVFSAAAIAAWDSATVETVVIFGSVNDIDVTPTTLPPTSMTTDIKNYIETLATFCPNLQRIIWFDTFFTPESYKTNDTANRYAQVAAHIDRLNALAPNPLAGGVTPVQFIRVRTNDLWFSGGAQPRNYAIGSHPNNAVVGTARTAVADGDVHPTAEGMAKIADIVWPYLKDIL
jgi:lysophospholipase L1-like esterase